MESGKSVNMIEALFWKNKEKRYLGLIKNPTNKENLSKTGGDGMYRRNYRKHSSVVPDISERYRAGRFAEKYQPW